MSHDRSLLACEVHATETEPRHIRIFSIADDVELKHQHDHKLPYGFSSNGEKLFHAGRDHEKGTVNVLDLASGECSPVTSHPKLDIWELSFSPDERWMAFHAVHEPRVHSQVFVAPYVDGTVVRWLCRGDMKVIASEMS